MTDKSIIDFFEGALRKLLPSVVYFRVREGSSDILLSVADFTDFMEAGFAIGSANISCELSNTYKTARQDGVVFRPVSSLVLIMKLSNGCVDGRLVHVIGALLVSTPKVGSRDESMCSEIRDQTLHYDKIFWPDDE